MRIPPRCALAAALALPLGACMANSPDEYSWPARDMPYPEGWVESGAFPCGEFDLLWETAKVQACKAGHRIDDDATSYKRRRIVTVWKVEMAVRKSEGKRRRRFVDFVEQETPKGTWRVRVSTVRQRNVDIDDPLNPVSAEWRSDDPDTDDAERVAWMIESKFREFGPSPGFDGR